MTKVDSFESVFRSASKAVFRYDPIAFESVLVVSDRDEYQAKLFSGRVRAFLKVLDGGAKMEWRQAHGGEFKTVKDLLDLVERVRPGLICTYRHLHSESWRWPFSLGEHLDVLMQATSTPVVVLPHPDAGRAAPHAMENTNVVMAMTDLLTGADPLVNHALRFTEPGGTLYLAHVEDQNVFERYMEVISKIPEIDTAGAREEIRKQLLKEPEDYIRSCREGLAPEQLGVKIEPAIGLGHHLREYVKLVEQHEVDLLVLDTKDEEQLAMHGLAYPLAVELRQIPLLML